MTARLALEGFRNGLASGEEGFAVWSDAGIGGAAAAEDALRQLDLDGDGYLDPFILVLEGNTDDLEGAHEDKHLELVAVDGPEQVGEEDETPAPRRYDPVELLPGLGAYKGYRIRQHTGRNEALAAYGGFAAVLHEWMHITAQLFDWYLVTAPERAGIPAEPRSGDSEAQPCLANAAGAWSFWGKMGMAAERPEDPPVPGPPTYGGGTYFCAYDRIHAIGVDWPDLASESGTYVLVDGCVSDGACSSDVYPPLIRVPVRRGEWYLVENRYFGETYDSLGMTCSPRRVGLRLSTSWEVYL